MHSLDGSDCVADGRNTQPRNGFKVDDKESEEYEHKMRTRKQVFSSLQMAKLCLKFGFGTGCFPSVILRQPPQLALTVEIDRPLKYAVYHCRSLLPLPPPAHKYTPPQMLEGQDQMSKMEKTTRRYPKVLPHDKYINLCSL